MLSSASLIPLPRSPQHLTRMSISEGLKMTPADLCAVLDDFEPLAMEIAGLEREAAEKEAAILKAVLGRLVPLVPLLCERYEAAYRRKLTILTVQDKVPLCRENNSYFYFEQRLILYENGSLILHYRSGMYSDGCLLSCEMVRECEITSDGAIAAFGFSAVVEGLISVLRHAKAKMVLKEELESKIAALTETLEAVQ